MNPIYARLRMRAREIAAQLSPPDFYIDFPLELQWSRSILNTDPLLSDLRLKMTRHLSEAIGHGMAHAMKVAQDVGVLMGIEGNRAGYDKSHVCRRVVLGQCAALLHDIRRDDDGHAEKGAHAAKPILKTCRLAPDEIEDICLAIRNHEAFSTPVAIKTIEGALVADCLYDADKFRWGPDNFTDTVWEMVSHSRTPFSEFVCQYPKGLEGLCRIKATFRTPTGKQYGPQFIDLGLTIGRELYKIITTEYP